MLTRSQRSLILARHVNTHWSGTCRSEHPRSHTHYLSSSLNSFFHTHTHTHTISLPLSPPSFTHTPSLSLNNQEVMNLPDEPLDRVLFLVYDMDNIMLQMRTEKEDQDLRKTYGFLFQFLKKNMLQPKLPSLAKEKLGVPPFEKPSIAKVYTHIHTYTMYMYDVHTHTHAHTHTHTHTHTHMHTQCTTLYYYTHLTCTKYMCMYICTCYALVRSCILVYNMLQCMCMNTCTCAYGLHCMCHTLLCSRLNHSGCD